RAADHFGSQAVVLSLDIKRSPGGGWAVYAAGGRKETGLEMVAWAARGAELGAGEIVLNSIDADGMTTGYDIDAIRTVARAVNVPVVASGGAGSAEHMRDALLDGEADAALAAGIFHRGELTIDTVKAVCLAAGLPMRPPVGVHATSSVSHHERVQTS